MIFNIFKNYCIAHAAEMLLGAGIVSTVTSIVLASRGGTKAKEAIDLYHERMDYYRETEELNAAGELDEPYTPEDAEADRKDSAREVVRDVALAYLPCAVTGIIAITCFGGGMGILNGRLAVTSACLEATALSLDKVTKSFDGYRARVKNELGEIQDEHFLTGAEVKEVTRTVTDKDGKKKKVKKKELDSKSLESGEMISGYQFIFGPENPNWLAEPSLTKQVIDGIQNYADSLLQIKKVMCLNDVLAMLDIPPTDMGLVVGWSKYSNGDGSIDFRTKYIGDGKFLLDFNCDGSIYGKVEDSVERRRLESGVMFKNA